VKRFARHLIRWQWIVVVMLVCVTGVALSGMTRLRVDPSNAGLLPRQGDDAQVYQRFLTTFGSDEDILVAFHDPQQSLLAPEGLAAVQRLTQALAELPHVAMVHSLTNAQDMTQLRLTPFGIAVPRLIPDESLTPEQVQAIQRNAQVIGTLLSADLHTAGILVVPENVGVAASSREAWLTAVRAVAAQHADALYPARSKAYYPIGISGTVRRYLQYLPGQALCRAVAVVRLALPHLDHGERGFYRYSPQRHHVAPPGRDHCRERLRGDSSRQSVHRRGRGRGQRC
jgi:hypothetical protein